jgi:hypothetical protein
VVGDIVEKTGEDDKVREYVEGPVAEMGFVKLTSRLQRTGRERMQ